MVIKKGSCFEESLYLVMKEDKKNRSEKVGVHISHVERGQYLYLGTLNRWGKGCQTCLKDRDTGNLYCHLTDTNLLGKHKGKTENCTHPIVIVAVKIIF